MISSAEVSFVVQGPISDKSAIAEVLTSIRSFFPQSRIILSTWVNSNADGLLYDEIIYSQDPGASHYYYKDSSVLNNNNRQIVSSYAGLSKVITPYAVKTRTDIVFKSSNLLVELDQLPDPGKHAVVKKRILAISNLSVNPNIYHPMAYHPSDFFFAGASSDLLSLFSIPLMDEETMDWFYYNEMPERSKLPSLLPRYSNEQYIYIKFLEKHGVKAFISDAFDLSEKAVEHSEYTFAQNLCLRPTWSVGINSLKYPINMFTRSIHAYTVVEWRRLLAKHSGVQFRNQFDFERIWYKSIESLKNFTRYRFYKIFQFLKSILA